jgi:hypothetical protein
MAYSVYWIRHPDHTDMFTQGYIGISKETERRWLYHRRYGKNTHLKNAINKYGWDNLVKEIILISDKAYCLMIEAKLRAEDKIGWNIVKGGGNPPSTPWNKGTKLNKEIYDTLYQKGFGFKKGNIPWNKGLKYTQDLIDKMFKIGELTKGKEPWNKGISIDTSHLRQKATCPHCNKQCELAGIKRWHMDNCKYKDKS